MEAIFDITNKHPVVFWEISLQVFSKYHFRLQLPMFTYLRGSVYKAKICSLNYYIAVFMHLHSYTHENLFTISQFCEITHFWERSIVSLTTFGPNKIFSSLSIIIIIIIIIIIAILSSSSLSSSLSLKYETER